MAIRNILILVYFAIGLACAICRQCRIWWYILTHPAELRELDMDEYVMLITFPMVLTFCWPLTVRRW